MKSKYRFGPLILLLWAAAGHAQEDATFAIRGRVVGADTKPVAGATVRLLAPGFNGFDADEKTTTDADGRYSLTAPRRWTRMDAVMRQELGLIAVQGKHMAAIQFNRNSAPPRADVELKLIDVAGSKITILSPDRRPVAGARVKIGALKCDTIRVDLTEAEVRQYAGQARKTPIGYAIASGAFPLPEDLQIDLGRTDAHGQVAVTQVATSAIGGVAVESQEFGEQTILHHAYPGAETVDWISGIALKKVGRVVGQLSGLSDQVVGHREVTVASSDQDGCTGTYYNAFVKVTTDAKGKFEVPKMLAGRVLYVVKFDPSDPVRAEQAAEQPFVKPGETLSLKITIKPAVRVEGQVLEADSKKPVRDVLVRVFVGIAFESATSDVEGKFHFWLPPGETAFHLDVPEGYLSLAPPSDYYDPSKYQKRITIFKVPEARTFEAPPLLLHRPVTLRGVVLDDQNRPLQGARVSAISLTLDRRTGQPKPLEVAVQANERGEFAMASLDPREPIRLRILANNLAKVVTIAKPASELVRVVMASNERFRITGQIADSQGKPVGDAVLEVWHRDWRPGPVEAEPKKLDFKELIRSDEEGRFRTPTLAPDGHFRFTIRASGVKTTESAWLDATKPDATQPQRIVVTLLGGLSGVVRDRQGKPVVDALVYLIAKDTQAETSTNRQGEFKVEIPAGKPFCVVVRHPQFRVEGSHYGADPSNLDQTMTRVDEPATVLPRRPLLDKGEREKLLKRLLDPVKQKLAKSTNIDEKAMTLQSLTGAAPEFVVEFLDKHPFPQAVYNEMLQTQIAMRRSVKDHAEVEEMIGRMSQGAQKSMAYGRLVDALPDNARAKKLELISEALIAARAEKSPEFRALALGQVAKRLFDLGDKERSTTLLREGEKIAVGLSTSAFAGYARGAFAEDLALIDLPAALALMKDLKDSQEFARHHGNTAHRIARLNPTEAVRVLDRMRQPGPNEFNQRDQYAIRVCYRMAQVDLLAALKLANSIVDVPSRAYALGVIAQAIGKTEPKQATDLIRRAYTLVEDDAARPDPPQLTSAMTPGSVAGALVLIAEQVDPSLMRECLWRSLGLLRPHTEDPQKVWRYTTGNDAIAMAAARYDAKLAELLMPTPTAQFTSREARLVEYLIHPLRAVEAAEKAGDDRQRLQVIGYLAAEEDGIPRLIFNALGMWRIDVEDIDF